MNRVLRKWIISIVNRLGENSQKGEYIYIYVYTRKEFKVNEVMDSAKMPQKIALKRVKRLNF